MLARILARLMKAAAKEPAESATNLITLETAGGRVDVDVLLDPGESPVNSTGSLWLPDGTQITAWVCRVLAVLDNPAERIEVSVRFASSSRMHKLNSDYRGQQKPTNVLSFPADMPLLPLDSAGQGKLQVLGDIVLCPEVISAEAAAQGKPLADHWAHLLVHGVLHLYGYDHETAAEADAMESAEIQILLAAGIANPYNYPSSLQPDE